MIAANASTKLLLLEGNEKKKALTVISTLTLPELHLPHATSAQLPACARIMTKTRFNSFSNLNFQQSDKGFYSLKLNLCSELFHQSFSNSFILGYKCVLL
jgi:hypothetical protein